MRTTITSIVISTTIACLLSGCESGLTPQQRNSSILNRNIVTTTLVANAWSAPAKLGEWTTKDFYSTPDLAFTTAVTSDNFMVGWASDNLQTQFALHSSAGGTWQSTKPDLSKFKRAFSPALYTNPNSSAVYATWYSPDVGASGNFISRYTVTTGWTPPHAFSNTPEETKVIVGDNGEAVLLWESYAENGTLELNARRVDAQGNLTLLDTHILGQPGRLPKNLTHINGILSANGTVNIYGLSELSVAPDAGLSEPRWQLWNINYSAASALSKTWSQPQLVPNTAFSISGYPRHVDIVPVGANDLRIFINSDDFSFGNALVALESNNGVWKTVTPRFETPPFGSLMSPVAVNSKGQLALAWLTYTFGQDVDKNSTIEFRVFEKHYDSSTGWSAPVQVNNPLPQLIPIGVGFGSGDEPRISINSAGQMAVAWRNPIDRPVTIYSNFYDPVTQWRGEELAIATSVKKDQLQKYDIILGKNGDSSIIWQESIFGVGGLTTATLQAVDHVGAGNGVAKTKSTNKLNAAKNSFNTRMGIRTNSFATARTVSPPLTTRQRIERLRAVANPAPIRVSSAWDEPTLIGEFALAADQGYMIDTLNVNSNDRGESLISYLVDPSNPTSLVWSGNTISGGWKKDSPPFASSNLGTYVMDTIVDPKTGNFNLGWLTRCTSNECGDLFVSSKLSDGTWEPATSLGQSVGSGLDLLVSSKGIGAAWYAAMDAAGNPKIAYAEHNETTGWATPDFFSPAINNTVIGPLGHSPNFGMSAILGESGVVSIIANISASLTNNSSVLVQRTPAAGWKQTDFPVSIANTSISQAYLAAATGDAVHALVSDGFSSAGRREMSYQYANGQWATPLDVTAPKKGDIFLSGVGTLPISSNSKGQVLAAWSEQVYVGADPARQVRVNWFDPVLGWGKPIEIGYPVPGNISFVPGYFNDVIDHLQVSINESGQGAVAWIDTSGIKHALNVVHLNATMTDVKHEIIFTVDPAIAQVRALDLDVDNQGRTLLAWDELTIGMTQETHRVKTTTHHAGGTISPQPIVPPVIPPRVLPTVPPVSVGWSAREVAWTLPAIPGWQDLPQKTAIVVANNQAVLAVQVDRSFDTATEQFATSDRTLASSSAPGVWTNKEPFGSSTPDVMGNVQLVADENAQAVYALWTSQHALYINRQNSSGVWGQPLQVASNAHSGVLLANTKGQVAVVWESIGDPSTLQAAEVTADATNTLRMSAATTSTLAKSAKAGQAVLSNLGTIAVMRAVTGTTGQDFVLSKFEFGKGWQAPTDKKLSLTGLIPNSFQLAITSANQTVAFAQSDALRTLHSTSVRPDGTWNNWSAVQIAAATPTSLTGQYRIGTSSAGHLYVVWVEENIRADGEPVNNLMFSSYGAPDVATGNPWLPPTPIVQIEHPHFSETPLFLVGRDGAAAVVWKQTVIPFESSAIKVMKYQPSSGWKTEPETAASFVSYLSTDLIRINAEISASNGLYIVWETPSHDSYGYSFPGSPSSTTIQLTRGKM